MPALSGSSGVHVRSLATMPTICHATGTIRVGNATSGAMKRSVGALWCWDQNMHVVIGILPRDFMLPATVLNFESSQTRRPEFFTHCVLLDGATSLDLARSSRR